MFNNKSILITGGTGTFGKAFTQYLLDKYNVNKICIYSRDEFKQSEMEYQFNSNEKLRFLKGDVRDKARLYRAFKDIDIVIHAAAMKQVPACEYDPMEAIKTNIIGAMNVIDAAIDNKVDKVIALSTDKAKDPLNLYGATKMCSDKLFVAANAYSTINGTKFSLVRYGNVAGSRGSVIPLFEKKIKDGFGKLPVTDERMTRFWITLDQAIELVDLAAHKSKGGETFISKIPSFYVTDLVQAFNKEYIVTGIRPGEKLHEIMINESDAFNTYEYEKYYIVYPVLDWYNTKERLDFNGKLVSEHFSYVSNVNEFMTVGEIQAKLLDMGVRL